MISLRLAANYLSQGSVVNPITNFQLRIVYIIHHYTTYLVKFEACLRYFKIVFATFIAMLY
jgi:DNA-binding transcriptional regulator WhiA